MTDSIEIPKKKAPPKIDVLARQIEALKNDATTEKLKTVEPRLSRLSEKIQILKNSREQHVEELTTISEEFEKIREELEVKLFFEKFEASEKVARFLRENPDKKIENLKPADYTTDPELQKPSAWKNILEDAQKGLAIAEIFEDKKFDWKNPKAYLEKAGNTGEKVLETAKKNPLLFGAFLVMSGITFYQFLKKDSKVGDKIKGLLSGGAATYLGISLLKENFSSSIINLFGRKILGEKNWERVEKFFGEKEKKEKPKQAPEDIEKYGKMMPLSKAIGNYREDAEDALRPITTLAKRNKDALAILTTAGFVSSGTVRDITLKGVKMTAESALTLAKLPLKAVRGFPLTSLFAATGLLLGFAKIKKGVKEFEVPKNSDNMQKFLKAKIQEAGETLSDLDIPAIPDAHLPIIAGILTGEIGLTEFVAPAEEMLAGLVETGFEKIELTHEELIRKRNLTGLESFRDVIENIKKPESAVALIAIEALKTKVENDGLITPANIEKIKTVVAPLGFAIRAEDGRLKSVILDKNGVARVQSICIDPKFSANEQFEVAQTFFVESDNWLDAAGKTVEIPFEQLRLALGNLHEDVKTETEVGEIIGRKLKEGCVLATIGDTLYLIAKGGTEKFILGPAEMLNHLLSLMPGGQEFSCVEMAIGYADGLLPVAVFGIAGALASEGWKAFLPGRIIARTWNYPYTGTKKVLGHIIRPLLDRNPKAILTNPAIEFTSSFNEFCHRTQSKLSWLKGIVREKAQTISALHKDIADLNRAKKLLADANGSFGKKRTTLVSEAREAFSDIEVKDKVFGKKSINDVGKNATSVRNAIEKTNEIIQEKKLEIKQIRSNPTPPKTSTSLNPKPQGKVVDFAKEKAKRTKPKTQAQLRPVRQIKPELPPKPAKNPRLSLIKKPELQISPETEAKLATKLKTSPNKIRILGNTLKKAVGAIVALSILEEIASSPSPEKTILQQSVYLTAFSTAFHVASKTPVPPYAKLLLGIGAGIGTVILGQKGFDATTDWTFEKLNVAYKTYFRTDIRTVGSAKLNTARHALGDALGVIDPVNRILDPLAEQIPWLDKFAKGHNALEYFGETAYSAKYGIAGVAERYFQHDREDIDSWNKYIKKEIRGEEKDIAKYEQKTASHKEKQKKPRQNVKILNAAINQLEIQINQAKNKIILLKNEIVDANWLQRQRSETFGIAVKINLMRQKLEKTSLKNIISATDFALADHLDPLMLKSVRTALKKTKGREIDIFQLYIATKKYLFHQLDTYDNMGKYEQIFRDKKDILQKLIPEYSRQNA